ncbi:hypothetical protein IQ06DRAFT_13116 [Phaeosphaeriaceae sp. SRC1lsM3a]|nr:hypothetical protein IQ06DRAFT_13116 [Stagonospora sp. SRC1lsM3a]
MDSDVLPHWGSRCRMARHIPAGARLRNGRVVPCMWRPRRLHSPTSSSSHRSWRRCRGTSHTSLPFLVVALSYYHLLASAQFISAISVFQHLFPPSTYRCRRSPCTPETQRLRLDSIETSNVEQLRQFGFNISRTKDIHSHIVAVLAPDRIPGHTCYTHYPRSLRSSP